jgi:hypothetical protein
MNPFPSRLIEIARRYVWWSTPEQTLADNLPRLVAQAMELGTWEDAHALLDMIGRDAFVDVLRHPPAGVFSPKSWSFWHHRLGLGEAPELETRRRLPAEALERQGEVKLSCFGGISHSVGVPDETADGVLRIASPLDLLAQKLKVILQRAEARDNRGIAALLQSGVSLSAGLGAAAALFAPGFPVAECVKALAYFKDLAEPSRFSANDRNVLIAAIKRLDGQITAMPLASEMVT